MCDIWMHWMLLKRVARMQDSQVHYIEDCSLTHQIVRCIVEFISMAWLSQISDGFNRYRPTSNCQQVLEQHVCSLFIEYHQAIYQQVITNWKDQGMRLYSTCGQNKCLDSTNRPPACSTSILPNILQRSHPISMAWLFQNRMYCFTHVTIIFHWVFKSMTVWIIMLVLFTVSNQTRIDLYFGCLSLKLCANMVCQLNHPIA